MPSIRDLFRKAANLRQWLLFKRLEPYTMVGHSRLYTLDKLVSQLAQREVSGSLVECGVWRGGAAAVIAAAAERYGSTRPLWLFDSFAGLPEPTAADGPAAEQQFAKDRGHSTVADVEAALYKVAGVSSAQVHIVPGWFEDTLPASREAIGPIALLRLDCDWYESTKTCLDVLYASVVPGGFVVFDDYGTWPGCRKAVDEFLQSRGLHVQLCPAGDGAVYFQVPPAGAGGEYWRVETQRYIEPHLRLKRVAAEVLAKPGSVLDIGCGPGTMGTLLAAKNVSYSGVDIFEQELGYGQYASFDLSRDSFANFPFSRRFAWVTVSGVLEYLYEPRIHELLRFIASSLLEPGGNAVITYTNFSHYSRTASTFHPRWTTAASPRVFRSWLARAGFKIVRAYPSYYYILKRRISWGPKIWIPMLSTLLGRQVIYVLKRKES